METAENWLSRISKAVSEREDNTVLWTDKIGLLKAVAVTSERNVIENEAENKLQYKNINIEIQRMWNAKCFVITLIIGASVIVTKKLKIL